MLGYEGCLLFCQVNCVPSPHCHCLAKLVLFFEAGHLIQFMNFLSKGRDKLFLIGNSFFELCFNLLEKMEFFPQVNPID